MAKTAAVHNEYEVVMYPRMNHVKVGLVDIVLRSFHMHREMELGLVVDGHARLSIKGTVYPLEKGSLYFCNSNEAHEIVARNYESVKIIYVQIANTFCQDYLYLFRNFELLANDLSANLTFAQNKELTDLMLNVVRDYLSDEPLGRLHCLSDLCRLFCRLLDYVPYRKFEESFYQKRKKQAVRMQHITEYIDTHAAGKISLAAIAAEEQVSPSYISHLFHAMMGMSLQEYINNVRLSRAIKLMSSGNMRLLDICLESGFSDMKYLNQMFKKQFGCSAKEYRHSVHIEAPQFLPPDQDQQFVSSEIGLAWLAAFEQF